MHDLLNRDSSSPSTEAVNILRVHYLYEDAFYFQHTTVFSVAVVTDPLHGSVHESRISSSASLDFSYKTAQFFTSPTEAHCPLRKLRLVTQRCQKSLSI